MIYIGMFLVLIKGTFREFIPKPFPNPILFCWYFYIPSLPTGQDLWAQRRESCDSATVVRSLLVVLSGLRGFSRVETVLQTISRIVRTLELSKLNNWRSLSLTWCLYVRPLGESTG